METFLIKSAAGKGTHEFFNRAPVNPAQPLEAFHVRITDRNLFAMGCVSACYANHPVAFFVEMAQYWSGWKDALVWQALESELILRCTHDRLGHLCIAVELRSGWDAYDWQVQAAIMAEAGQLEQLARHAARFFGEPSIMEW